MRAGDDWIDKLIHEFGAIAAVTVEKHNDIAFRRKNAHSRHAGTTVTASRLGNYLRAGCAGMFRRSIITAIVDDDNFARDFRGRDSANHIGNWFFFI